MPFSLAKAISSFFFIDIEAVFFSVLGSAFFSVLGFAFGAAVALGVELPAFAEPIPVIFTVVKGCLCPCFFL